MRGAHQALPPPEPGTTQLRWTRESPASGAGPATSVTGTRPDVDSERQMPFQLSDMPGQHSRRSEDLRHQPSNLLARASTST